MSRIPSTLAIVTGLILAAAGGAVAQQKVPPKPALTKEALEAARKHMVETEVIAAGVKDERVVKAMRDTPRHEFVSHTQWPLAYLDMSLPIGESQTISAPVIVAYMTEELDPQPGDKVLEIGTGSGYQAAVLSPLVKDVYSIEIKESLGKKAEQTLKRLNYTNIHTKIGDGYLGWPEHAPFDKIIVTCSPEKVPQPLIEQLADGGRLIVPVGERYEQVLYLYKKKDGKLITEALRPTLFVPMTGKAEDAREVKPDPLHPKIINGSFEEQTGEAAEPRGWYYIRQMKVVSGNDAPDGEKFVKFTNETPGLGCRALQGFAIDGRKVHYIELSCMMKGKNILPGPPPERLLPDLSVSFFGENRALLNHDGATPVRGTFDWQRSSVIVAVPPQCREAILYIGLYGATGEISYDDVQLHVREKK